MNSEVMEMFGRKLITSATSMTDTEIFSNPLAPPSMGHSSAAAAAAAALTNADFRKLLMTPRAAPSVAPPTVPKIKPIHSSHIHSESQYNEDDDRAARRRKKKSYYAKLKKMEEEREQELAAKYRDRAKERREGDNPDYEGVDEFAATANYRAVGPTAEATNSAAERRRMAIQESKFLGGDMEHTHLVKGLDFALLQKVRSEIATDEGFLEPGERKKEKIKKEKNEGIEEEDDDDDDDEYDDIDFKTRLGQRIYKAVFKNKPSEKNELFMPGRMAYVFDLEDEYAESDIPTTLIRSKTDCPSVESQTTLTTNDIVINKLTQILSYLRQGTGGKKMKKKEKEKMKEKNEKGPSQKIQPPAALESIYGDIGEYDPSATTKPQKKPKESDQDRSRQREKERERKLKHQQYFEHPQRAEMEEAKFTRKDVSAGEFARSITQKFGKKPDEQRSAWESVPPKSSHSKKKSKETYLDSYAECYPGAYEDTAYDSEEEADYSKMDMGNKKGPVRRWDFDTDEEYSKYMENREAMPKAAFQFGIKMSEGRKTRRAGPKDEKAKLDRDWQRISQMLKRSGPEDSGHGASKKPRH